MKLSKIYSNKKDIFDTIIFNEGFNVIFAKVKKRKDSEKDSHNLGKTLLIDLIEFLLLKSFDPSLFLKKHYSRFDDFEFYLEILLNSGKYLTIKRTVKENTKICFKLHNEKNQNYNNLSKEKWDHFKLPFEKSVKLLNSYLDLNVIDKWSYRKGVSYFLRNQNDYRDVFQIEKFTFGEHIEWKPYLAKVLGFNYEMIKEKYNLDNLIKKRKEYKEEYEQSISTTSEEYDRLKGAIEIKKREIKEASVEIDKFNFYEKELKLNEELIDEIESKISELNNDLYNIQYEIEKIETSLLNKIKFNLKEIKEIYEESKIHFPDKLSKDYGKLVSFNNSLYEERSKYLKERLGQLKKEGENTKKELKELNLKRSDILKILRGEKTFNKFKELQNLLLEGRTELVRLESQLDTLNTVAVIQKEIDDLENKKNQLVKKTTQLINEGNKIYSEIRLTFNKIVKEILNVIASLYIIINKEGNLEFKADIIKNEKTMDATGEGEGTSYKKILCSAFDLAVLKTYSKDSFFKFVYHDGILEGLDDRKKINLLELIRKYCEEYNIQYILTVIDSDIPRDVNEKKIEFNKGEIIKTLHDGGNSGRLFKMDKF